MNNPTEKITLRQTGKFCSACGEAQVGAWGSLTKTFIVIPMEHLPTCTDIDAPLIDVRDWDINNQCGVHMHIPRPAGPWLLGSKKCKSGSLASGGEVAYCTCSICWVP